eukprot:3934916-Rhodomonas_salina.1
MSSRILSSDAPTVPSIRVARQARSLSGIGRQQTAELPQFRPDGGINSVSTGRAERERTLRKNKEYYNPHKRRA